MAVVALATEYARGCLIPLTYGFAARVAAGPKISPLGQFAVRVAAPRLTDVAQVRSRTAQAFRPGDGRWPSPSAATIVWLQRGLGRRALDPVPLILAASLEGFLGYCLGCTVFGWLIRAGVIPEEICVECGGPLASLRRP